jgi:hypothetical protein
MNAEMAVYLQKKRDSERVELKAPLRNRIEQDIAEFIAKGNNITVLGTTRSTFTSNW